jgi:hypothetical protein
MRALPEYLKKIRIFTALLWLSPLMTIAQGGDFILTHHSPKHSEIDNINFQITADKNGLICVANRFGLLQYDGLVWDYYTTPSSALSLGVDDKNNLYIGCIGEFGRMDFIGNKYQYVSILKSDSISDHFIQTTHYNNSIYFLSSRNLFHYDIHSAIVKKVMSGRLLNLYTFSGGLFLNTEDGKAYQITGNQAEVQPKAEIQWGVVSKSPKGTYTYALELHGELYEWNGQRFNRLKQNDKLKTAGIMVSDFEWVNDSIMALSTIESGVVFLNAKKPNYIEVTNYHSGLPDNEIHDLFTDQNSGVWVAHEFGLTHIAPLFPARSYTNYPGLEGNLIEAQRIKGDLWVNTSLGVYYFSQDTSYTSVVIKEPKEVTRKTTTKSSKPVSQPEPEPQPIQQPDDKQTEKKGFLKGLTNKKNRIENSATESETKTSKKQEYAPQQQTSTTTYEKRIDYVQRIERVITGVSYQFKKVPGTDGKFKQLLYSSNKILATSHSGIYEITRQSAQRVIDESVRYAFAVPNSNILLISTQTGFLKAYTLDGGIWRERSREYFEDVVLNIYMDSKGHVWLAGTSHIYRGEFLSEPFFDIVERYEINNRFFDELSIWERKGELYFINSQGYFKFDEKTESIVRDTELAKEFDVPHHHIHNEQSRVWLFNGRLWRLLKPDGTVETFNYLSVFPDLKYVSYDEQLDKYWLITQSNQLLSYSAGMSPDQYQGYNLFVKRLSNKNGQVRLLENLKFKYDENYLDIELLKPDYLGLLNPEYQYQLKGLHNDWSNWTHANLIDYSYIPPGKYELMVRVRDAFGNIEEMSLLKFEVMAPYWQRPWFYLAQLLLVTFLVAFTSRLQDDKAQNKLIKSALSILTLVYIIEFLQAIISAYVNVQSTPVVDFLIDASIALFVFPLEWLLRKLMLEGGFGILKKRKAAPSGVRDEVG